MLAAVFSEEVHETNGAWFWLSGIDDPRIRGNEEAWRGLARRYAALASITALRAEANLRGGVIRFRLGETEAALDLLDQVESYSAEPALGYLSRFFRGKALERLNRVAEAETAYRSALDLVPRAQSASTALASSLFLRGQQNEADTIIRAAIETRPVPADPWRLYWCGDCRLWPSLIAQLRQEVRR